MNKYKVIQKLRSSGWMKDSMGRWTLRSISNLNIQARIVVEDSGSASLEITNPYSHAGLTIATSSTLDLLMGEPFGADTVSHWCGLDEAEERIRARWVRRRVKSLAARFWRGRGIRSQHVSAVDCVAGVTGSSHNHIPRGLQPKRLG